MILPRARRILISGLLAMLLLVTACGQPEPTRWDQAQQESTQAPRNQQAGQAVAGGKFNKLFPNASGEYQLVYSQEKEGFAEGKLKKGGQEVAILSINDIATNPSAVQKYQQSTKKIAGYPAVDQGSTATAILVANRFQVKVMSRNPSFTASDREAWLQKFNLGGLAQLK